MKPHFERLTTALATAAILLPLAIVPAAAATVAGPTATVADAAECKAATERATGGSPDHALQNWVSLTSALYGTHWADWPAARDREVLPRQHNGITLYQAVGTPCLTAAAAG